MSGTLFLTGATGFLGSWIARRLLEETEYPIVVLVRAEDREAALLRLARAWWEWPELAAGIGGRIEALAGDISAADLGLEPAAYTDLVSRVTHIVHAAADIRLAAPLEELRATNVQGTANLLELARTAHRDHGLVRFSHLSTAYVAGARRGPIPEDSLTDRFGFFSPYEQSKYEAELLAQEARHRLPLSVFRPGMIVGDSRSGAIRSFNTLYFPLRLYLTGRLPIVPARRSLRVNLVPVDYVAEAVVRLTLDSHAEGLTFHLTAPAESLPTAGELVHFVRGWAQARLGVRPGRPLFLPLPLPEAWKRLWATRVGHRGTGMGGRLLSLLPYLQERREFRRDNVDRLLGPYPLRWRDLLPRLLDYAAYYGFMHRSERTVHEQILFRLQARSRPVTFHDIAEGQTVTRGPAEVRRDMLAAAAALHALGIGRGDRVALVGLNSSRYLTADVAIGLVGAVSVPLYYTSPPAELDPILRASGVRLLLIGAPALLERMAELQADVPTISFCRGPVPAGISRAVLSWEEFLALGAGSRGPAVAPAGPRDLATLRYTSGTTGEPKGVIFHHAHLRWMGEAIAALLPWKAKNRPASYLSFLPMNHVVEGILGSYSPYYIPAPVDLYFLEDFHGLPRALAMVHPSIFFSVPRFYEKVWENLANRRIGRLYLESRAGPLKGFLRILVRRSLLRRAGLDRCAQLIAGSAPSSADLLRAYQELGIEIHDAYGLTEAPLVTINRLGRNRLGTVGEPLPQTEILVAEDGEVLVRGPQVTAGYLGAEAPLRDGWLLTGDLGRLTAEGSLILEGRKKELLKTTYGKYVNPATVEHLLHQAPGVVEAMVVGEGRPYCVALLWVGEGHVDEARAEAIARAIVAANAQLSHPEQVKRWAILAHDLSVEGGDLTANLKLKRQTVARRFAAVVEALYGGDPCPAGVLHVGAAER